MAYFNHAFRKMFVGTKIGSDQTDPAVYSEIFAGQGQGDALVQAGIDHGFITSSVVANGGRKIHSSDLQGFGMGPGTFAFFDKNDYTIVNRDDLGDDCCPLVLISASIRTNDKLGQFHGGYQESNKSKIINPKYIQEFYKVDPCLPQQAVLSIGTTPFTIQEHDNDPTCCKSFYCGETYYLRIDVKGSPALRALNHNAYQTLDAYTGCCPTEVPTVVDPTLVYISWASKIIENNYLKPFIMPVVFDYTGVAWYAPGTTVTLDGTNTPVTADEWWTAYPESVQAQAWTDATPCAAGMRIYGAYVDTKFGDCSFQPSDFFEKEPVQIYASLVDYTGDPCVFEGVCVYDECKGLTGQGFGETVIRDLILSESYLQNFYHNDDRIREITGGDSVFGVINRNSMYTRYFLLHSVPRFNNPTGVFDNDRYLLEIVVAEDDPTNPVGSVAFEQFMGDWLDDCSDCDPSKEFTCHKCGIIPDQGD